MTWFHKYHVTSHHNTSFYIITCIRIVHTHTAIPCHSYIMHYAINVTYRVSNSTLCINSVSQFFYLMIFPFLHCFFFAHLLSLSLPSVVSLSPTNDNQFTSFSCAHSNDQPCYRLTQRIKSVIECKTWTTTTTEKQNAQRSNHRRKKTTRRIVGELVIHFRFSDA